MIKKAVENNNINNVVAGQTNTGTGAVEGQSRKKTPLSTITARKKRKVRKQVNLYAATGNKFGARPGSQSNHSHLGGVAPQY